MRQLTDSERRRHLIGLCITARCKNNRTKKNRYCHACVKRRWRAANPMKYLFAARRDNAKRRGKEWGLTFAEFQEFCDETMYDKLKGRTANCLSIDRDKNEFGYFKWNIKAVTVSYNASKGDRQYYALVHRGVIPREGGGGG